MYRIDNTTANAALPAPSAAGPNPDFFWSDGNPAGGVAATVVEAEWLNMVQEELAGAVAFASLALDKADRTQLRQAIETIRDLPFASTVAINGYQKFPGGLIFQWGNNGVATPVVVTFPIAFPTAPFIVVTSDADSVPTAGGASGLTTTGFTASGEANYWMATGH